jgi:hypothetical protein
MPRDERRIPDSERSIGAPDRSAEGNRSADEPDRGVQRFAQLNQGGRRPTPSQTPAPADRRKTADRLLITDGTNKLLQVVAPHYVQQHWRLREREAPNVIALVESWKELVAKLKEYDSIDHLVLMFHGMPGDLRVGRTQQGLTTNATELWKDQAPRVREIDLEGCSVAKDPEALVAFGKIFNASRVTGWNHWWILFKSDDFPVPPRMSASEKEKLQRKLDGFRQYFVKSPPTAEELAAKPGKHFLVLVWFRKYMSTDKPPEPERGSPDRRERVFKPRRNGTRRLIRGEQEARDLRREYDKSFSGDDVPFHQVVVNF